VKNHCAKFDDLRETVTKMLRNKPEIVAQLKKTCATMRNKMNQYKIRKAQ